MPSPNWRKHQIRVHMAYIGFPIAGDPIYGRRKDKLGLKRHFLHAAELTFRRPSDDEELHLTSELPDDLARVLAQLSGPASKIKALAVSA